MSNNTKLLSKALVVLDKLEQTLATEQQVLLSTELDALDSLLPRKRQLLEQLAVIEPRLIEVLQAADEHESSQVFTIKTRLNSCRQRNQENHTLTAQGINNVGRSLTYLHSAMQIGSVSLYNPRGKAESSVGKRHRGVA